MNTPNKHGFSAKALPILLLASGTPLLLLAAGQALLLLLGGRYRNWVLLTLPFFAVLFFLCLAIFCFYKAYTRWGIRILLVLLFVSGVALILYLGYATLQGLALVSLFSAEQDIVYGGQPAVIYAAKQSGMEIVTYDVYAYQNAIWSGPYLGEVGWTFLFP